jgi:hypothetical protein
LPLTSRMQCLPCLSLNKIMINVKEKKIISDQKLNFTNKTFQPTTFQFNHKQNTETSYTQNFSLQIHNLHSWLSHYEEI